MNKVCLFIVLTMISCHAVAMEDGHADVGSPKLRLFKSKLASQKYLDEIDGIFEGSQKRIDAARKNGLLGDSKSRQAQQEQLDSEQAFIAVLSAAAHKRSSREG